ncbi:MAG: phage terminase large subunit [Pseudomonadota bacterium]
MELSQQHIDNVAEFRKPGGFFKFCQIFFPVLTGRDYVIPRPNSRRPHVFEMCEQLEYTFFNPTENLGIFIPPGHLKTTHLILYVAWTMSIYPDCNWMYTSYSKQSSSTNTAYILALMQSQKYQDLFLVRIDPKKKARDDFYTLPCGKYGAGRVYAAGFEGTITGVNAGMPFLQRFSGGLLIDDIYNVGEANSATIVAKTKYNYVNVLLPRIRGPHVPTICICQNTGDQSLIWDFVEQQDIRHWRVVKIPAMDAVGNALAPEIRDEAWLNKMKETQPYLFKTQYQQEKVPLGDPLFEAKDFPQLNETPEVVMSFITIDSAETDKTYNDATALALWGVYKLKVGNRDIGKYGIYLLNLWEERVMPAMLLMRIKEFYAQGCMFKVPPTKMYIEKKSTGVTALDILRDLPGIEVMGIDHNSASGSKADRFIEMQQWVKQGLVAIPEYARHTKLFIDHMISINPGMTHKHDDICDATQMACDVMYKSKIAVATLGDGDKYDSIIAHIAARSGALNEIHGFSAEDEIGFYKQ